MAAASDPTGEEYELPAVEAALAATLALMTGYSQALQAALHPAERVLLGARIGRHLALLADHPLLSLGFQQVLAGLERHWAAMNACTGQACAAGASAGDRPPPGGLLRSGEVVWPMVAPARLQ